MDFNRGEETRIHKKKKARLYGRLSRIAQKSTDFAPKCDGVLRLGRMLVAIDENLFGRHARPLSGFSKRGKQLFIRHRQLSIMTISGIAAIQTCGRL